MLEKEIKKLNKSDDKRGKLHFIPLRLLIVYEVISHKQFSESYKETIMIAKNQISGKRLLLKVFLQFVIALFFDMVLR